MRKTLFFLTSFLCLFSLSSAIGQGTAISEKRQKNSVNLQTKNRYEIKSVKIQSKTVLNKPLGALGVDKFSVVCSQSRDELENQIKLLRNEIRSDRELNRDVSASKKYLKTLIFRKKTLKKYNQKSAKKPNLL
ncbi:hypothetical protein OAW23_07665 [Flavobacteriales bacterium]|nr:hypothetical protein [Flavobacteriales bacterium]